MEADGAGAARDELAAMEAALTAPRTSVGAGPFMNLSVPTLDAALGKDPRINLALFSIPGASVRREAERALARGLHCLIFSDNVPVEDEVALKRTGFEKGLLVMGPDCGTAHIGGVGLGFCNVMRPGKNRDRGRGGNGDSGGHGRHRRCGRRNLLRPWAPGDATFQTRSAASPWSRRSRP